MPSIELKNICKYVCQDVNLTISDKEFMVVLGSNGAGKTTLINVIAGLVDYKGTVLFDDVPVDKIPANRREVGYLFQGGTAPPCEREANVDGMDGPGGPIDVADLTYLVAYLFQGGPLPPMCHPVS